MAWCIVETDTQLRNRGGDASHADPWHRRFCRTPSLDSCCHAARLSGWLGQTSATLDMRHLQDSKIAKISRVTLSSIRPPFAVRRDRPRRRQPNDRSEAEPVERWSAVQSNCQTAPASQTHSHLSNLSRPSRVRDLQRAGRICSSSNDRLHSLSAWPLLLSASASASISFSFRVTCDHPHALRQARTIAVCIAGQTATMGKGGGPLMAPEVHTSMFDGRGLPEEAPVQKWRSIRRLSPPLIDQEWPGLRSILSLSWTIYLLQWRQ